MSSAQRQAESLSELCARLQALIDSGAFDDARKRDFALGFIRGVDAGEEMAPQVLFAARALAGADQ